MNTAALPAPTMCAGRGGQPLAAGELRFRGTIDGGVHSVQISLPPCRKQGRF